MRKLYSFLCYLAIPFILIRLFIKGRRHPAYMQRIKERFVLGIQPTQADVWIHAVSMGEVVAAKPMIANWLSEHKKVLVTTMTPTGSEQVKRFFSDQVIHQYLPYDLPLCIKRFYKIYQPQVGVIMETEIWPNLITYAKKFGTKLYLANGRISDKAYQPYHKARWFFRSLWPKFDGVFAQSNLDKDRMVSMGAAPTQVQVLGNIKNDLSIPPNVGDNFLRFKQAWGQNRPVLIAASTHEGEELALLNALPKLQSAIPNLIMLIAPRHPERFETVKKCVQSKGFRYGMRSSEDSIHSECEVVVLDCLGEMLGFYAMSDYAFVGGSLVSIGGHNVLEPIALGLPVVVGPYMQNSQSLCDLLLKNGAMTQVKQADEVMSQIELWYSNQSKKELQIQQATQVFEANQGALKRHLDAISVAS